MALTPTGLAPTESALAASGTKVPIGMRVKWYQRAWELYVEVEGPDIEQPEISVTDDGQITMRATVAGKPQLVCLKLLHGVKAKESRWVVSTRSVKFELPKAGESRPHWDRLTVGEKLPNIVVDWGSWIDEEEEAEIRANPYGHDVKSLAGAMGRGWGSNTAATLDARRQAAAVNTSNPDDSEDDICMA
ncbi:hypothetical protein AB1Y20_021951 [Prymnesium parvum]|uniref:CS domain-containing protein n=1 Tax=Prymnesium parvum TaxID=97485 RepID=A0AB34JGG7_PRYPA